MKHTLYHEAKEPKPSLSLYRSRLKKYSLLPHKEAHKLAIDNTPLVLRRPIRGKYNEYQWDKCAYDTFTYRLKVGLPFEEAIQPEKKKTWPKEVPIQRYIDKKKILEDKLDILEEKKIKKIQWIQKKIESIKNRMRILNMLIYQKKRNMNK